MNKNKWLKVIERVTIIVFPIIVTPIIMLTNCASYEPIIPDIEVNSIQAIKLVQNNETIFEHGNEVKKAQYKPYEIKDPSLLPNIVLNEIEIFFYINNDLNAYNYKLLQKSNLAWGFYIE